MNTDITIQRIRAAQTLPLRSLVLRPGRPLDESVFAGDDDATTVHFGAVLDEEIVAVASLYHEPLPPQMMELGIEFGSARIRRLRGMAVSPAHQRRGIGRALLNACLGHLAAQGETLLWCNARASAVGFYLAADFSIAGDAFMLPVIGEHFVMYRVLR